ncbi:MAG: type II toxin-antitoxin system VapC family toxin [bacterium]
MKLPSGLHGRRNVVLDTMVFIYLFEDSSGYGQVCEFLVDKAGSGLFSGIVTPITAAELVVKPIEKKREDLADRYILSLQSMKNIKPVFMDFKIGQLAGALRAKYKLPLPYMIQAAFALCSEKPTIITNDKAMKIIKEVQIYLLDQF